MNKIPEFMLRNEDKNVINFCKRIACIKNVDENIDELLLSVFLYDKKVFGNDKMITSFVNNILKLLRGLEDYFDYKELFVIKKNLDFIAKHPYLFPKLIYTNKPNMKYQSKFYTKVYSLYLTNEEKKLIAHEILSKMKEYHFSQDGVCKIEEQYGIKSNNDLIDILRLVMYRDDLESMMVSFGIKPYTNNYDITKNKGYVFSWKLRSFLNEILHAQNNAELEIIMQKIINERSKLLGKNLNYYTPFIKERIYKLAFYMYDHDVYRSLIDKVSAYFLREDQKLNEENYRLKKTKRQEEKNVMSNNAIEVLEKYINNHSEVNEEDLIKNLAIIKRDNIALYNSYIKRIYEGEASEVVNRFISSKVKSLNQFLYNENISFFTFNKYRLLVDEKLSDELKLKLKNDSKETYNKIISVINKLLENDNHEYFDYAYLSFILTDAMIIEKTLISFIENAVKKDKMLPVKYNKLKKIQEYIKKYMNDKNKYNHGTKEFYQMVNSLKEYNNVKLSNEIKQEAIKYLIDNNCEVNYYTVRSILIRYIKTGGFELHEHNNKKIPH